MRGLFFGLIVAVAAFAAPSMAQERLTGLARLAGDGVVVSGTARGAALSIDMSRSVPWRVFTLDGPARLVVDFSELDWTGADEAALAEASKAFDDVRVGLFRPGWSRLVAVLAAPMTIEEAGMRGSDTAARVEIRLAPTDPDTFAANAGAPDSAVFKRAPMPDLEAPDSDRLVVVLDPGHGGIDPGAEREGVRESDLVLTFARELKEVLSRTDNVDVFLTRDDDVFVPLEERVSIARAHGADVFLSLHADALAQGQANGATVYTLADEASDVASQKLAERHDREDLLAGVDLSETGDEVALVLMDLARTETQPRADKLADALVQGIHSATQSTYKTPRLQAGFSVLKAPDIPSALIELGFLSSKRDREKMTDPDWRQRAASGIRDALLYWALEDEAAAGRLRQ